MAWLLFMDESGHSHKELPFEVRGGFTLADTHLWPFVQDVLRLEWRCFGARLADYKSEIKGMKLLSKERFEHAAQMPEIEVSRRQQCCRALLQAGLEKRPPTKEQLTAYGQASLNMADGIFELLERHKALIFASAVPRGTAKPPVGSPPPDILRKDHIFLLERFFYFLERERQMGLLVMDEVEKKEDRRFVRKLQDYFVKTANGRDRSRWIVPSPFFVASDMALPVQVADVVIYALNWGYRLPANMKGAPTRSEIESRFSAQIQKLNWKGEGFDGVQTYKTFGIFCVPDLYIPRT